MSNVSDANADKQAHKTRMQEMIKAERKVRQTAARTPAGVVYLSTFTLSLIAILLVAGLVGSMLLPAIVPDFKVDSTAFTAIITLVPLAIAQLTIYRSDRNQHRTDDVHQEGLNGPQDAEITMPAVAKSTCVCSCGNVLPTAVEEGE